MGGSAFQADEPHLVSEPVWPSRRAVVRRLMVRYESLGVEWMKRSPFQILLVAALAALASSACGGTARSAADLQALALLNRQPHSPADARFMTAMIPHHAQAVLFAGWAESHEASQAVQVFCARMVVAQSDEIVTMRSWLGERGEDVPAAEFVRSSMRGSMPGGADPASMMPGMLTEPQLAELDSARGAEFDRLFLTYMIPHHQGALSMVDELFGAYGGAQNDFVYKLASDIYADQEIEIERMQILLAEYPRDSRSP